MGFWKDVRELRDLIHLKVAAGHGRRALHEAVKEQVRNQAVVSDERPELPSELPKGLKKLPPALAEKLMEVPEGQQLKMSAEEYRKLLGQR